MRNYSTDPTEPRSRWERFRVGPGPVRTGVFVVVLSLLVHVAFEVAFLDRRGPVCQALGVAPRAGCCCCGFESGPFEEDSGCYRSCSTDE
jgi:hypothetical protein